MRSTLFVGNLEFDTRESDLDRLFRSYGKMRVDLKSGTFSSGRIAFVYFENRRDAEEAIRGTNKTPFGHKQRKLSVEWAKVTKEIICFDYALNSITIRAGLVTRLLDVERKFEPYGKVVSIRLRRDHAIVQFERQEDATKALDSTHSTKILDRIVLVEYARGPDSPVNRRRSGYDRYRSRSPIQRARRASR